MQMAHAIDLCIFQSWDSLYAALAVHFAYYNLCGDLPPFFLPIITRETHKIKAFDVPLWLSYGTSPAGAEGGQGRA